MEKSLCQTCFNYDDCPWHLNFEPRPDWVAVPTLLKMSNKPETYVESYRVIRCPAFRGRTQWQRATLHEMGELFGVYWRTIARHAQKCDLHDYALKRGYEVLIKRDGKYHNYYIRKVKNNETDTKNI